jgi:hypothetical protein
MPLLSTRRFAISRGIAIRQPIHACRAVPHVHLDDVHALLRLSYETLKGLKPIMRLLRGPNRAPRPFAAVFRRTRAASAFATGAPQNARPDDSGLMSCLSYWILIMMLRRASRAQQSPEMP